MLGADYSANQMSYDLRRLRLHGLVARIPHTNTYTLTPEGQRVAIFYTKLAGRHSSAPSSRPTNPQHHQHSDEP